MAGSIMAYHTHNGTVPTTSNNGTDFVTNIRKNQQAIRDSVILGGHPGWDFNIPAAYPVGDITGTTMTVTTLSAGVITPGMDVTGSGVTSGTKIVSQLTSTESGG